MRKKIFAFGTIFGGISFFLFLAYVFLFPLNKSQKIVELSPGDRLSIVADRLYNDGIINSTFLFKVWMTLTWNQTNLKIGEYSIPAGASLNDVKNIITSGRMYNKFLTIPEGLTVKQIFEILEKLRRGEMLKGEKKMSLWKELDTLIGKSRVIDLAPLIERGMPKWPTHPQIIVDPTITHEHDGYYSQCLVMGEHTGAHVDCPAHIIASMMDHTVDTYPANMVFGPAIKYEMYKLDAKPGDRITREQILKLEEEMGDKAGKGDIVLMEFGYQKYWKTDAEWKYYALNEPGLSEDACELFAERGVKAVGSDTIACDTPVIDGEELLSYGHKKYWLPNEIFIMEMLMNLEQVPRRSYFMALPLKIKNGSGSPIRPIVIVE